MLDNVKEQVYKLMEKDDSGHGIDHIQRVLRLTLEFSEIENADKTIASLIALLHDVDDYKLFGMENAKELPNAKKIMNDAGVNKDIQKKVLKELSCIGYSKRLNGIIPESIEGKIVSDADMCDALGVNGILRAHIYCLKNKKTFFNKNIFPMENVTVNTYAKKCSSSSVCHMFEKLLRLKNLMLTTAGKKEAEDRHEFMINFLYHFFAEEDAKDWQTYLDIYLANL